MSTNKGFSSLALVIFAVIILGGGYWVWQNQAVAPVTKMANIFDKDVDCDNFLGREKERCLSVKSQDLVSCAKLPNSPEASRDNCYKRLAPKLKDYSICEKIKVVGSDDVGNYAKPHNYYSCLSDVSIALDDINTCRSIENKEHLQELAKEQEGQRKFIDEKTLQEIFVNARDEHRSWCTFYIATGTKNKALCKLLPEVSNNFFTQSNCTNYPNY